MILNGILAEGVCVVRLCQSCVDRQISWSERTEKCCYTGFKKVCCVCFVMKNSFEEFRMENAKFSCSHMINRHMRISLHYKLWGCVGGGLKSVSFLTFVFYNYFMGFVSKSMHFLMLNNQLCHCLFCEIEDDRSHEKSKNPGVVSIKKICDGLEISVREFFDSDLFDDLEQEVK